MAVTLQPPGGNFGAGRNAGHGCSGTRCGADSAPPVNVVPPHAILPGDPGSLVDKRAYGVIPNYRTAELDAPFAPLTVKQKFTIGTKDTLDWPPYITALLFSGISQLDNSHPSFGQGTEGFAKRYGAAVADQDIGNMLTEAALPSLFHQDPRFFRKGQGSVKSRIYYAASRVVVAKSDAGRWQFNVSEFLGNGMVASIGNLYYPDERGFGSTMQRMFSQIGTDAVSQVAKEFWPDLKKHFSHKQ